MKKILFVINTFSRAGAEKALLELMRQMDSAEYDISLFVLTAQGELFSELPPHVHIMNASYYSTSVLSRAGRKKLRALIFCSFFKRGAGIRLLPYLFRNLFDMLRRGSIAVDKLFWRVISDGAPRWDTSYDLAVAYIEGGSTYYVADHVNAAQKAAFVHIDYGMAGYTRKLDLDCYREMDKIFVPAEATGKSVLEVYPEYKDKLELFPNILNVSEIRRKSLLTGGFDDGYAGERILTVCRLTAQKALEISVEAMKLLKDTGKEFRWYILGEGDQRAKLEQKINALGLTEDFILCGAVENPYPYFRQTDLYVHASRFEARSISIREAQILGCPILASDCGGNLENVSDGVNGKICSLTPESIRDGILWLMDHPEERKKYAEAAERKYQTQVNEENKLTSLLKDDMD